MHNVAAIKRNFMVKVELDCHKKFNHETLRYLDSRLCHGGKKLFECQSSNFLVFCFKLQISSVLCRRLEHKKTFGWFGKATTRKETKRSFELNTKSFQESVSRERLAASQQVCSLVWVVCWSERWWSQTYRKKDIKAFFYGTLAIKECRIFEFFVACNVQEKVMFEKIENFSCAPQPRRMIMLANLSLIEPDGVHSFLEREFFLLRRFLRP